MIFSEDIVLRSAHFEGNNLTRHGGRALALCRFGLSQSQSLVAIAQTLDKLLVYDLNLLLINQPLGAGEDQQTRQDDKAIQVVFIKDQVISTLEVVTGNRVDGQDVLLIGCASSIMIYATRDQTHLSSVNTSARPSVISSIQLSHSSQDLLSGGATLLVCAGIQKLYAYQLLKRNEVETTQSETPRFHLSLDLSSERTVSESISCLACGTHDQLGACLVTGSREHKIKVYPIDAFDQNIQAPRLELDESGPVSCLCPVETLHQISMTNAQPNQSSDTSGQVVDSRASGGGGGGGGGGHETSTQSSLLPSLENDVGAKLGPAAAAKAHDAAPSLQMNYLAYGLENGTIGVYHLLTVLNDDKEDERSQVMMGERLWRHKSKQTPVSLIMFDCNGDGLDELIVGYRNGRLEVRSPFTGQLLAATRLFGAGSAQLVGLVTWPLEPHESASRAHSGGLNGSTNNSDQAEQSRHALLACSSTSSLVAIRPRQKRPREPLRDYLARSGRDLRALSRPSARPKLIDSDQALIEDARELVGPCEPLQLDIETRGDNLRPVASESRQSAQLMQKIGVLSNGQGEMGARLRQLHQEWSARVARAEGKSRSSRRQELETLVHVSHIWDFDSARQQLRLTLLAETSLRPVQHHGVQLEMPTRPPATPASVDMIELVDADSGETLERGRQQRQQLVIGESQTNGPVELWLNASQIGGGGGGGKSVRKEWRRLRARVFCRPTGQETTSLRVHEQLVELGPYATFVPESQINVTGSTEPPEANKVTLTFGLSDRVHRLRALDWLQANFLCFHYGQVHSNNKYRRSGSGSPSGDHYQDPLVDMIRHSVDSTLGVGSERTSGGDGDELLEFKFVDLRRAGVAVPTSYHLRISFTSDNQTDELVIETDDSDLLVELVKSLVLDRLQLNMQDHLLMLQDRSQSGVEPLLSKLSSMIESSRQLEESENRIQTEIYESAEHIKLLMQQFTIANQLNEFATSRELLGEIAMMLDRTQNSAQSYQLNNRSRQELTREATCLREKISFLTGDGASAAAAAAAVGGSNPFVSTAAS